jgi:aminoglycoside 6-adenylyltransferase
MTTVAIDDALRPPQTYEHLTERFVKWAETQPDIHAAMVIGSRARTEWPADEWSDLDSHRNSSAVGLFLPNPG